jgi:hypothetical protein
MQSTATDEKGKPSYPLLVTRGNCVAVTGLQWRLVIDGIAPRLGVPVLQLTPSKRGIPAARLLAALEHEAVAQQPIEPQREISDEEERAQLRQRLGLRHIAGGAR